MNNFDVTLAILMEGKKKCCEDGKCGTKECTEKKEPAKITIEKDRSTGDYRCPAKDGREAGACYDDDKESIVDTAKAIWGKDVVIKFRTVPEFVGKKYEDAKKTPKKKPVKKK